jgi:chromosome segregation ATPase
LRDLAELLKSHELDKSAMEEAIAQLADDRDEIEANRDSAVLHAEELQTRVTELERHLEQTQEKLQVGEMLRYSLSSVRP